MVKIVKNDEVKIIKNEEDKIMRGLFTRNLPSPREIGLRQNRALDGHSVALWDRQGEVPKHWSVCVFDVCSYVCLFVRACVFM